MSYQTEFDRLQKIIVSDDSSPEQRAAARKAKEALIDRNIEALFTEFESRTSQYTALIDRLQSVIDRISANQLTGVIDEIGKIATDVEAAASGNGGE